jgi:glutamate-1-semialdehyde 2,1-aminomutase
MAAGTRVTFDAAGFYARAGAVLPGGVNSPVRAWNGVGGHPVPIASAKGARVIDAAGNGYIDLVCSWGAAIVGHAHPHVVEAVSRAAERGLSFGATTEAEVELAEEIRRRYPPAQQVRLVSTGTEATMTAIRLARAATGRVKIVKFAGCYHGHSDALLVAAGSGLATAGTPDSAGVTAADTIVLPYGDVNALTDAFAEHGAQIAGVISEAAPANMGVVAPPAGFNELIASLCRNEGAVFMCDEVLTGFRAGPAGYWGVERDAATASGTVSTGGAAWVPDLVTFGKVIGGGLPVAAVGGRADLMQLLAPVGAVYQAGTLSGNPVAVAAGRATLELLDAVAYARLADTADYLASSLDRALAHSGRSYALGRAGTLVSVFLGLGAPPVTFDAARAQDTGAYAELFHAWRRAGVYAPPSAFEALFVSLAHTHADIDAVVASLAAWANS